MKLFIVLALAVASASAASLNTISKLGFPEGRVINGEDAAEGEAPFMVSLQYRSQHFCGGSILGPNWIATAAHCLKVYVNIVAVVGINRLNDSSLAQTRKVTEQIQHEDFAGGVGPDDIGLAYLKKGLNLNPSVGVIGLPLNPFDDTGDGKLYGFGYDNSGHISNKLQVLDAIIIGFVECNKYWSAPPLNGNNSCIRKAGTTDSACSGDSGGPLVRNNILVGIVSWGRVPCGQNSAPSVFTTVSAYIDWIHNIMNSI